MRHRQRLYQREQFSDVYRGGSRMDTELFMVLYRANQLRRSRFAVVVNKRFGSAVTRNKAKRKARILFDLCHKKISPACDILLFPKKGMLSQKQALLIDHFRRTLEQAHLC
ncbi:MAG: ribonuclease P protein component [Nitrospirae bacterium]|nr:ribonuclease P protein component [Nitrospirota bacterium]